MPTPATPLLRLAVLVLLPPTARSLPPGLEAPDGRRFEARLRRGCGIASPPGGQG